MLRPRRPITAWIRMRNNIQIGGEDPPLSLCLSLSLSLSHTHTHTHTHSLTHSLSSSRYHSNKVSPSIRLKNKWTESVCSSAYYIARQKAGGLIFGREGGESIIAQDIKNEF